MLRQNTMINTDENFEDIENNEATIGGEGIAVKYVEHVRPNLPHCGDTVSARKLPLEFNYNFSANDQTANGKYSQLKAVMLQHTEQLTIDRIPDEFIFSIANERLINTNYLDFFATSEVNSLQIKTQLLSRNGVWFGRMSDYADDKPISDIKAIDFGSGIYIYTVTFSDDYVFEMLVGSTYIVDQHSEARLLMLAAFDKRHLQRYAQIELLLDRYKHPLFAYPSDVYIIGGLVDSFKPTVDWSEITHSEDLLMSIRNEVDSFFQKGVDIYKGIKLNPFRKILLAGVPGTGKTMICNALAKDKLAEDYAVVYISGSDRHEAQFWKISSALEAVAHIDRPALIIVEELDAYMSNPGAKSQVLNILDGSESMHFKHGVMLIATTNHPEKIDKRVLKRPGRIDRIYIVPELETKEAVISFLHRFLGEQWDSSFVALAPKLIKKPGSFLREVCLYAMIESAYTECDELSLADLERSLESLTEQIQQKDDFLDSNQRREMGLFNPTS